MIRYGHLLILILVLCFSATIPVWSADAETRTWTSARGDTLEAAFESMSGSLVILKKPDGKKTRIRLSQLSSDDQAWLRKQQHRSQAGITTPESARDRRQLSWTNLTEQPAPSRSVTGKEQAAVSNESFTWRWAETPHFIIHYEKAMFALKVARMAEFFYDYIAEDLRGPEDRVAEKSHIYVFDSDESWQSFLALSDGVPWAAAYVRGNAMFLQRVGGNKTSSNVLAHEMTHLVLNRFFKHQPPHWLNEGLAEWYEYLGRALFKGIGKNPKSAFKDGVRRAYFPLDALLQTTDYPAADQIPAFYNTSKYVIGFLRLEHEEGVFVDYVRSVVLEGEDALAGLYASFGYAGMDAFYAAFSKFADL